MFRPWRGVWTRPWTLFLPSFCPCRDMVSPLSGRRRYAGDDLSTELWPLSGRGATLATTLLPSYRPCQGKREEKWYGHERPRQGPKLGRKRAAAHPKRPDRDENSVEQCLSRLPASRRDVTRKHKIPHKKPIYPVTKTKIRFFITHLQSIYYHSPKNNLKHHPRNILTVREHISVVRDKKYSKRMYFCRRKFGVGRGRGLRRWPRLRHKLRLRL